jgi:GntR family transcriptional regulator / MocR family aminotransferase
MAAAEIPFILLNDAGNAPPVYRQIYEAVRTSILKGELKQGIRLPSSRDLARRLGLARITIVNAYDQLLAEGYLEGRSGSGTYVAARLPEELLETRPPVVRKTEKRAVKPAVGLSSYGNRLRASAAELTQFRQPSRAAAFQNGVTAIEEFPFDTWAKLTQKVIYRSARRGLGYGEAAGLRELREAIAAHLASARGVRCSVEQVIVTNGAQQGLDLTGRILLEQNDKVLIEDPCYAGARVALASTGARLIRVPVDSEGFNPDAVGKQSAGARLVYVTPSHQYPLGVTMSLNRRLGLLDWAERSRAWIIEDDYNSEFRYAGRPLSSLQGLDSQNRVIYLGTFSKTIFPALRLACLVVPPDLVEVFTAARALTDYHSPHIEQAVLADFIAEGHFARHIRRMRALYEKRQAFLIEAARQKLNGLIDIEKADAGMHLVGRLPETIPDVSVAASAAEQNLLVAPLSSYAAPRTKLNGLILGYTGFNEKQIARGVDKLAKVLGGFS